MLLRVALPRDAHGPWGSASLPGIFGCKMWYLTSIRMRFAVLFVVLAALPLLAQEAEGADSSPLKTSVLKRLEGQHWEAYAETGTPPPKETYELYSFDPTRMERLSNGHFKVWIREDFSTSKTSVIYGYPQVYDWSVELEEVSCKALETMVFRQSLYEVTGTPNWDWTARKKTDLQWDSVVPGTNGEVTLKLLCDSHAPRAVTDVSRLNMGRRRLYVESDLQMPAVACSGARRAGANHWPAVGDNCWTSARESASAASMADCAREPSLAALWTTVVPRTWLCVASVRSLPITERRSWRSFSRVSRGSRGAGVGGAEAIVRSRGKRPRGEEDSLSLAQSRLGGGYSV